MSLRILRLRLLQSRPVRRWCTLRARAARWLFGTVTAIADGVATVQLPGGATIRARGQAAVADVVFVRDGVIEGPAPALTLVTIDV